MDSHGDIAAINNRICQSARCLRVATKAMRKRRKLKPCWRRQKQIKLVRTQEEEKGEEEEREDYEDEEEEEEGDDDDDDEDEEEKKKKKRMRIRQVLNI